MTKHRILIVEDQSRERDALARLLRTEGYETQTARNCSEAMTMISEHFDAVISDLRLGQESGVELLKAWKNRHPNTPFLIATAYGEVETAVGALKTGAEDYLLKPLNPEALVIQLRQIINRRCSPTNESSTTSRANEPTSALDRIVGNSPAMHDLKDRIQRVANTDGMVLITGESGTGKELVAEAIHNLSKRSSGPFVAVNVAAVPESLVEAEFFGAVKGAFTGAETNRVGKFEAANSGTLFIDEIGDFPMSAQPKLLRVLENLIITPVGSNEDRKIDVRVVAATSRNLTELINQNAFRQDLFYRLNLLTIEIPPLRIRVEDVPYLIDYFLRDCQARYDRPDVQLSKELSDVLTKYEWPGNVRQLRNTIENMVVMGRQNPLSVQDLPAYFSGSTEAPKASVVIRDGQLQDLEREAIQYALERFQGNRTRAAEALGISVRTLQRKLKQWSTLES